jgi:hypothetical protein
MYSLIETTRQNGLEPLEYLRPLFERYSLAETSENWENCSPGTFSPLNLTDTSCGISLFICYLLALFQKGKPRVHPAYSASGEST